MTKDDKRESCPTKSGGNKGKNQGKGRRGKAEYVAKKKLNLDKNVLMLTFE